MNVNKLVGLGYVTLLALNLGAVAPLGAQTSPETTAPVPAATPTPVKPEKPICKTEKQTGSRFGKRVCHSAAEWKALAEEARRGAEGMAGRQALENQPGY
jgi:hypothetical protein